MPDGFGLALAAAFLGTVMTIFGIVVRVVDGVVSEIRLSIVPAVVDGVREWGHEIASLRPVSPAAAEPPEPTEPGSGTPTTELDTAPIGAQRIRAGRPRYQGPGLLMGALGLGLGLAGRAGLRALRSTIVRPAAARSE